MGCPRPYKGAVFLIARHFVAKGVDLLLDSCGHSMIEQINQIAFITPAGVPFDCFTQGFVAMVILPALVQNGDFLAGQPAECVAQFRHVGPAPFDA